MFLAALVSVVALTAGASVPHELTVMSWNVFHRGHRKEIGEPATSNMIAIIRKANPDVMIMIETYGCFERVKRELGYDGWLFESSGNRDNCNISVYSRYPILSTFQPWSSKFHNGGCLIDVGGRKVNVVPVWLNYLPDARDTPCGKGEEEILKWEKDVRSPRIEQIGLILKGLAPQLAEKDTVPIVMGGDFNGFSHLDWTEGVRWLYGHGGEVVGWPVSKAVVAAGFTDSFRAVHPNPLYAPGISWLSHHGRSERADRIDYIYSAGPLEAVESEVVNADYRGPLDFRGTVFNPYPSDHGFVLTKFRFAN